MRKTSSSSEDMIEFDSPEPKVEILTEDSKQFNFRYKIVVIGDASVGKSSLCLKGAKNKFPQDYNSTKGFEYYDFNVKIDDYFIKLHIWDTCGQENYDSPLIPNYYRDAYMAIIVYSIIE